MIIGLSPKALVTLERQVCTDGQSQGRRVSALGLRPNSPKREYCGIPSSRSRRPCTLSRTEAAGRILHLLTLRVPFNPILYAADVLRLSHAARDGDADKLKELAERKADFTAVVTEDGETPLHLAASNGHVKALDFMATHVRERKGKVFWWGPNILLAL